MTHELFDIPGIQSFEKMVSYIPFFDDPNNNFYELRVTDYYYSKEVLKFVDDFYKELEHE